MNCEMFSHIDGVFTCRQLQSSDLVDFVEVLPLGTAEIRVVGCKKQLNIGDIGSLSPRPDVHLLTLSKCHLGQLNPKLFQLFPNLLEIHMDGNHMKNLKSDQLLGAEHLQLLNLSDNSLRVLEENIFEHVTKLKVLDLSYNELDTLPTHVFESVPNMEELYLNRNHLRVFSSQLLQGLVGLRVLDLRDNMLDGLQADVLDDVASLTDVYLAGNPWDCHCGLHLLIETLANLSVAHQAENDAILKDSKSLRCSGPGQLAGVLVNGLYPEQFQCETPKLDATPYSENISINFMNSAMLDCNASGVPQPSVYWATPRGIVSHPTFAKWLPRNISVARESMMYAGQPTFYKASIHAFENGSLLIQQMRLYFHGEYQCVAVNPAGEERVVVSVEVVSHIKGHLLISLIYGTATMMGFLIISLIASGIHMLVERLIWKRKPLKLPDGTMFTVSEHALEELDELGSIYSSMYSLHWYSPDDSPVKCVTPADDDMAEEQFTEMANGIRFTLEDARTRLRCGVERQVFRIRNRAAHVRDSGSRYMHTLRESGSRKFYNIRETGSKQLRSIRNSSSVYANRMRAGMVLGVEQVKYHVQSMKELCGTGEMSHTISTVSVSTDVDSRRKTEVVRTVTYV